MVWAALAALRAGLVPSAWADLWQQPALARSLALTLFTGLGATVLAWWLAAALLSRAYVQERLQRLLRPLPAMLATPHAAMAIGLLFLLSPSGWLLRAVSPGLTGLTLPPPWPTTQDPWGLGLVLALVIKEVPFLLWSAATQLQRADVGARWRAEHRLAQTLGYPAQRAFWRVVWPQLAPRLRWPLLAVLAYSLTVVDMALVIGPASPPTLAVLAWQWLGDVDAATYARGAAAGVLLLGVVGACSAAWWLTWRLTRRLRSEGGHRGRPGTHARRSIGAPVLMAVYAIAVLVLLVASIAGVWTFPAFWPQSISLAAWQSVIRSSDTLWTTLWLAAASSAIALVWCLAWLELAPRHWDDAARPLLYLPLLLPAVLWVVGLYGMGLQLRWEGQPSGVLLAHGVMVLPYVLLTLSPAYLGFDPRYAQLCATLGRGRWHFLWRVKWPLLRRAIAGSAAVGFAVSVTQYLPTLYLGAGRYATVTTEAVNLAAGGQRSLTAAYAVLQFVLPVLGFAVAAWVGRPRRFRIAA
ncbi:MAG: ABC transporter permease subunit [Hydrogenophaga sp.]|nr:ABC transporter permease subunit [Hydrogenophaga sp.]